MQLDLRLGITNCCSCAVDHGTHNCSARLFQICGKNAIILADSTWSFFHSEWRVMESRQTVFSGVLPGVESLCPRQKQA